jgi:hypothetical protein
MEDTPVVQFSAAKASPASCVVLTDSMIYAGAQGR